MKLVTAPASTWTSERVVDGKVFLNRPLFQLLLWWKSHLVAVNVHAFAEHACGCKSSRYETGDFKIREYSWLLLSWTGNDKFFEKLAGVWCNGVSSFKHISFGALYVAVRRAQKQPRIYLPAWSKEQQDKGSVSKLFVCPKSFIQRPPLPSPSFRIQALLTSWASIAGVERLRVFHDECGFPVAIFSFYSLNASGKENSVKI